RAGWRLAPTPAARRSRANDLRAPRSGRFVVAGIAGAGTMPQAAGAAPDRHLPRRRGTAELPSSSATPMRGPSMPDPHNAESFHERGRSRDEAGDIDGALADYAEAIRLE